MNAAAILLLAEKGLSALEIAEVAAALEIRRDPTAADRMARMRERKRNGVTRNVTANEGSNERDNLTSKEDLPQEANASLPQGAKPRVLWSCPPNVNPAHWRDFLGNRKRKRCAQTQTALDGVLADLDRIADDEWPPGKLVEYAAAKGWASINDPRESLGGTGHGQRSGQSGWQTAYTANMGVGGHN